MIEQVMVYEVKSSAVSNAKELFSIDLKYFYWNETKFKNLSIGDFVFVVNVADKWILFTKLTEPKFKATLNEQSLIATFSDGKIFTPKAPSLKLLKQWKQFIKLEVIERFDFPENWSWKTLGNSENTYLNGSRIGLKSAENRIKNINQLKQLTEDETFSQILENCRSNFNGSKAKPTSIKPLKKSNPNTEIEMNIITEFNNYLKSQGLIYDDRLVKRFIASLATKPFVILTGNSGSGKSRIALEFAKWMNSNDKSKYALVPVGADWTDNRSVLGYQNPLTTPPTYISTPILELIINANNNKELPYFLILDEMNLSHVERYFSDFLSLLESPDQPIKLHNSETELKAFGNEGLAIQKQINLPENLFVIGTVNIDETTYMFSPKVLDRANVIEIKTSKEKLKDFSDALKKSKTATFAAKKNIDLFLNCAWFWRNDAIKLKNELTEKELESCKTQTLAYFDVLEKYYLEFGFRTMDEAIRYARVVKGLTNKSNKDLIDEIIDEQVVQKFITKLNGSKTKMDLLLKELFKLSYNNTDWIKDIKVEDLKGSNKLAAVKLDQMIKRVNQDQFVSFI